MGRGGEDNNDGKRNLWGFRSKDFPSLCVCVCARIEVFKQLWRGEKKEGVCSLGDSGDGLLENHPP